MDGGGCVRGVEIEPSSPSSSSASTQDNSSAYNHVLQSQMENVPSKSRSCSSSSKTAFKPPENWANAPEFVPSWLASKNDGGNVASDQKVVEVGNGAKWLRKDAGLEAGSVCCATPTTAHGSTQCHLNNDSSTDLCPYAMIGECRYGCKCLLVHGLKCDYCGMYCLHPGDNVQRQRHRKSCIAEHESNMKLSFAIASSVEKLCGICYEKVLSKTSPGEQRFGILPNCNHCYCLSCIRRWRSERQFDSKTIRACPECRVTSDFVCPSRYWVDNKEDKEQLISSYKVALSKKPCRYYRNGNGQCPFGNKCFYLHAINGKEVDVGPPRRVSSAQGRVRTTAQTLSIWEYIEEWEMQWLDLEDFMGMFDSDTTSEFSMPDMDDDLDGDEIDEIYLDWDRM